MQHGEDQEGVHQDYGGGRTLGSPLMTFRSFLGKAALYDWKVWSFWQD